MKRLDLTGKRVGRLLVISLSHTARYRRFWKCLCDCGNNTAIPTADLNYGRVNSCGCLKRDRDPEAAFKRAFSVYRKNAKKRGLSFTLTETACNVLFSSPCAYCGAKPANKTYAQTVDSGRTVNYGEPFIHSGIDRVDNSIGYEPGNVVPCCCPCNRAKLAMSREDFISLCHRVAAKHPLQCPTSA